MPLQTFILRLKSLVPRRPKSSAYARGLASDEYAKNPYLQGTKEHADWEAGHADSYMRTQAQMW